MKWSRWQCLPKGRVGEGDQIAHSQNIHLHSGSISFAARNTSSSHHRLVVEFLLRLLSAGGTPSPPALSSSFQFYFGVNKLDILRDEVQRDETDIQFISGTHTDNNDSPSCEAE